MSTENTIKLNQIINTIQITITLLILYYAYHTPSVIISLALLLLATTITINTVYLFKENRQIYKGKHKEIMMEKLINNITNLGGEH